MKYSLDFSAVIFDLDGTLLYTLEEIAAAGNAALLSQGYAEYPVDAYRSFVGAGVSKLAWRILPESKRNQDNHDNIFSALLNEFERLLNTIARPYSGVTEVLSAFPAAGKKIAVLSNKPDEFTKVAVKKLLPDTDFFAVRGGLSDVPLKPAPDGALKLAREMGVDPEHTVFVGDSDVDIQTAVNAGMIAVGAGWGFRGAEELISAGAKIVFDEPLDLLKLL